MRPHIALVLTLAFTIFAARALAAQPDSPKSPELWEPLIRRLIQDGYAEQDLRALFSDPEITYQPSAMGKKLKALYRSKFEPPKPSGKTTTAHALEAERVTRGKAFLKANNALLRAVRKEYGVPPEIVVSILSVETELGEFLGQGPALAILASMAQDGDLAAVRRHLADRTLEAEQEAWLAQRAEKKSQWAYTELKSFLDYASANQLQAAALPGSIYGAIGLCQFMPSNALRFGVDGDHDGMVDLFNLSDAAHSLANFLKGHGWKKHVSGKDRRKVLFRYNHSTIYVNTILALAKKIRS